MPGFNARASAEKRSPPVDRNRCEGVAEGGKVGQPRETDLFEDAGHFAQEVDCLPIRLPEFNPDRMERKHRPLGEPAAPDGVGGFVEILDNFFSFRN